MLSARIFKSIFDFRICIPNEDTISISDIITLRGSKAEVQTVVQTDNG